MAPGNAGEGVGVHRSSKWDKDGVRTSIYTMIVFLNTAVTLISSAWGLRVAPQFDGELYVVFNLCPWPRHASHRQWSCYTNFILVLTYNASRRLSLGAFNIT